MQTCFELEEACSVLPGGDTGGGSFPAFTPVTTPVPTVPVTDKPVFDPNVTSFCGVDYNDAQDNVSVLPLGNGVITRPNLIRSLCLSS